MKTPTTPATPQRLSSPMRLTSVVVIGFLGWIALVALFASPAASAQTPTRYYPQTGYSISGPFLTFFDNKGGLRIFGYPISGVVQESGRSVQYFERQRMEYHPDKAAAGFGVELGLLGRQTLVVKPAAGSDNSRTIAPTSRGAGTEGRTAGDATQTLSSKENRLWTLMNDARQQAGAGQVVLDPALRTLALSRSRDMVARNYFSHTTPDGVDFIAMLRNEKISFKFAGEIITNNNFDESAAADGAFNSFMNSPHHHDIMLDPRYSMAGVGEATNAQSFHYFTMIFVQK